MDEYFSNYIKELDEQHKIILEELKEKKEQLKQLQYQFYHEDESIVKELYALRSMKEPDMERIKELEEKQKALPSKQQLQQQIDIIREEIKRLEDEFSSLPFEVPPMEITPYVNYKLENGCWLEKSLNEKGEPSGEYLYKAELGRMGTSNFKIKCDEHGIPIEMEWLLQGSATYGLPLRFKRKLILRQPISENLVPKVIEKEVPQIVEKKVPVEKFIPSLQCLCGWNLTDKLRMVFCPNCARSLYDVIKQQIEQENKSVLKNNNKKKKKWF
jgi:hypothetical protein